MPGPTERLLEAVPAGLLGLVIGSFLNVVVYRLPRGMSVVHPRSRCPACETQLAGIDNVPVLSWVALRGRCRHCTAPVSVRYPVVELVTGLLFAGTAAALAGEAPLAPLVLVEASVIAAAAIDLDRSALPAVVVSGGLSGALGLGAVTAATGDPARLGWAAAAGSTASLLWATGELLARRAAAVPAAGVPSRAGVHQGAEEGALGRLLMVGSTAAAAGWLWPVGGWIVAVGAAGTVAVAATRPGVRPLLVLVAVVFGIVVVVGAAAGGA